MNNITYVSYYTKGYYKKVMEKYLLPSLLKWNLPFYIKELPNKKQWKANTEMKPQFILDTMNWHNTDIVWADADSIIRQKPVLFDTLDCDVAAQILDWQDQYGKDGKELLSGTLYFRNNEKTKCLLQLWIKYADKFGWEQKGLEQAILESPNVIVYSLPRSYCYISTLPNGKPPAKIIENPVIEHFQASREVKSDSKRLLE